MYNTKYECKRWVAINIVKKQHNEARVIIHNIMEDWFWNMLMMWIVYNEYGENEWQNKKQELQPWRRPEWIKCLFVKHPWSRMSNWMAHYFHLNAMNCHIITSLINSFSLATMMCCHILFATVREQIWSSRTLTLSMQPLQLIGHSYLIMTIL